MLLQVLYDNLNFKDRVLTRKRVIRVDTVEVVSTFRPKMALDTRETLLLEPMESTALSEKKCGGTASNQVLSYFRPTRTMVRNRPGIVSVNLLLIFHLQSSHPIQNASSAYPNAPNPFPRLLCRSTHSSMAGIT